MSSRELRLPTMEVHEGTLHVTLHPTAEERLTDLEKESKLNTYAIIFLGIANVVQLITTYMQ